MYKNMVAAACTDQLKTKSFNHVYYVSEGDVSQLAPGECHLQIKSAPFLMDFHFKSAHLDFGII